MLIKLSISYFYYIYNNDIIIKQAKQKSLLKHHQMEDENQINKILTSMMTGQIIQPLSQNQKHLWSSLKISIGHLLIKGYRVFKYMMSQSCVIFVKREKYHSKYLYFKIDLDHQAILPPNILSSIKSCVNKLNYMKKNQQQKYSIYIIFPLNYQTIQIQSSPQLTELLTNPPTNLSYDQLLKIQKQKNFTTQSYIFQHTFLQQILINDSQQQQKKLKQILFSYIDTFGQKNKINYYKQLTVKSIYLINTLNTIIYQQTKPQNKPGQYKPQYNQIQSSCWTQFKTDGLKSDRKDIVLSGTGNILFLDLIFLQTFSQYIDDDYNKQVFALIAQCKRSYADVRVKVIRIQKNLTDKNIYRYETKLVASSKAKGNN